MAPNVGGKVYIVEHLDPELGPWSELEYISIAEESQESGSSFTLSSLPDGFKVPEALKAIPTFTATQDSVEDIYAGNKNKVCLLDPAAEKDLSPEDVQEFDAFLFGGILDRTSELRKKGFTGRRLGPVQMTTDTAVRVTRMVIQQQRGCSNLQKVAEIFWDVADKHQTVALKDVPYTDHPELKINEHESTQMPFRYVKTEDGEPIMPKGMRDLIGKDADKAIDDLF
ncbi:Protein arginine N-methyltransferase SFM1 [Cytospora mali]|uniref:Protein arginine N-methyltransferase SFM1 n=1 Tax=Cytospora mali TaxID=578113 RepID=A0A194W9P9_CYTMA|nr:Protein arginine N-methyltransferase SFM1 [Valsa mali]